MPEQLRLQLDNTRLLSLNFKLSDSPPANAKGLPLKFTISTGHSYVPKEKRIAVGIRVTVGENGDPFLLDIDYQGLFLLNRRAKTKEIEPFARINCPAILFPFVRECIADITRRAGLNPLILPAINFIELGRESDQTKDEKGSGA